MSSLQKRFALSLLAICLVVFSPMFLSAQIDGLPDGGNPDALAPSGLSYINNQSYLVGTAISTLSPTLTSTGGATVTYGATLPAGLSINSVTGAITGTPTAVSSAANYTITATNIVGNTTFSLNITVVALVPTSPASVTAAADNAQAFITYTAPADNGGSVVIDYTITAIPASGSNIVRTGITANPYTFNGLTNGVAYTFTVAARNITGTGGTITSNQVTPSSTTTWNGTSWSATAPDASQNGVIAANLNSNNINGTFSTCANLTINSGVVFTLNSTVTVKGTFVNNGTIMGTGTLILAGTSAQTISGNGIVCSLTINNSNGVTISSGSNSLGVKGILTLQSGTLTTNNNLTLKSTSLANTGTLAPYQATGNTGTLTGNVTVERYIPHGFRAYRDMAPEVYGAGTIFKNWQLNGASTPAGYGIFITGSTVYANSSNAGTTDANGFDKSGTSTYNTQDYTFVNGTWTALANTNATNLDPFTGYRLLVRGDRTSNIYTTPVINTQAGLTMYNATTLSATGQLVTGTVTYSGTGVANTATGGSSVSLNTTVNGFSLVANPYVAPVQWGTGTGSNSSTTTIYGASSNINGSYWYLDPTSNATGKYIAFNALTGAATVGGSGTYSNTGTVPVSTGYIQPGQAVFVQTTGVSPTVVFQETAKATSSSKASVFGAAQLSKLYVSLLKQGTTGYSNVDGAAIAFRPDFGNKAYGPQDALKLSNATDNLSVSDKGKSLSIDGRLPAAASDAIPLSIAKPSATAYQLSIDASNYISNGFEPMLYDAFKNTTKALGTSATTIDFTVDANNAASFQNRFTILFTPSALPVNSIVASASLNYKTATISWKTAGEKNVARYEVEKSADAKLFTPITQSTAKNTATASYTTTDNSITATTYYRIKAVSTTGATSYSNVAKLSIVNSQLSINLYPNPMKGKTLNVEMGNVVAGKYTISIYNALGQKVSEQTISHAGGGATHAISINNALAAGAYSVTISEAGSKQLVNQSIISVQQ